MILNIDDHFMDIKLVTKCSCIFIFMCLMYFIYINNFNFLKFNDTVYYLIFCLHFGELLCISLIFYINFIIQVAIHIIARDKQANNPVG